MKMQTVKIPKLPEQEFEYWIRWFL